MKTISVAVLLTCFNRRDDTLRCLGALFEQETPSSPTLSVYLVDDGSSDGTGNAVASAFPQVTVLYGDGELYWNGGMRKAFAESIGKGFDYHLWLNDDTVLEPDVLARLIATHEELVRRGHRQVILSGATVDRRTGKTTYGGVRSPHRWWPLHFTLVEPSDVPVRCDTMTGNCVLIPDDVVQLTGNLDPAYRHYLGDFDYGLRTTRDGGSVWLAPGHVGDCELSAALRRGTRRLSLGEGLERLRQPKGLSIGDADLTPFREWRTFCRRFGGVLWPLYWLAPYRRLLSLVFGRRRPDP